MRSIIGDTTKKIRVLAIDLDGTMANFSGWKGTSIIDDPIKNLRSFLLRLKKHGWKIVIWTTRCTLCYVKTWLRKHKIPYNKINENYYKVKSSKKVIADVYLDERAVEFNGVYNDALFRRINNFKAWWEK